MNGPMMTVLAMCGTHWIVGWPKDWAWNPVLKSLVTWTTVYFLLWFLQAVLYVEVVLKWLAF